MKYFKIFIIFLILFGAGFYLFSKKAVAPEDGVIDKQDNGAMQVNIPLEKRSDSSSDENSSQNQPEQIDVVQTKEIDVEALAKSLESDEVSKREYFFAPILDDLDLPQVHDALTRALGDPFYYKKNFYYMLNDYDQDGTRELFVSYATFGAGAVQGFAVVDSDGENLIGYPAGIFDGAHGLMIPSRAQDITGDGVREILYEDSKSAPVYMEVIHIDEGQNVSRIQIDGNAGRFEGQDWKSGGASFAFGLDEDGDGNDELVQIFDLKNCQFDLRAYEWNKDEFVPAQESLFEKLRNKALSFSYEYNLPDEVNDCNK